MEQIKFYVSNIDPNLLNSICGRSGELIKLIRSEKYINEEALSAQLFDGKWSHQNYLNLKSRTKRILMAYFLISPPKKSNETLKKIRQCRKYYLLGMSFIESGQRKLAKDLLLHVYTTATEYSFSQLAHDSAVELMVGASLERNAKKFQQYSQIVKDLGKTLDAERIAQQCYYAFALQVNRKRSFTYEAIADHLQHLRSISCSSTKYVQYYYPLCIMRAMSEGNYRLVDQLTDEALEALQERKGIYGSTLQLFIKNKAIAQTALANYATAQQLLVKAEQYAPARSYNLGILFFYQAVNALHWGKYQDAYHLYRSNRKNKSDILAEQWAIMGAYFFFLKQVGRLNTGSDRFSLGKYLNETAATVHDKTGNNVNILIAELLVYLVKNRGKFIDRVEAINNYSYKYLKAPDTQRAKWFIRILCMMPRADFHSAALQRIAKRQIENLEKYPIRMGDNFAVEILPFEVVLGMVLEQLERRVA